MSQFTFREQLEKHNNPEEVRQRLAAGNYNKQHADIAREYLASIERKEATSAFERQEKREDENLAISKGLLESAKHSNKVAADNLAAAQSSAQSAKTQARWAIWAAVISVIAAIVAVAGIYYQ